ncbi:g10214 [Coccomyxa elongata]
MISSVLEHLKVEDIQILLENRGLPSIGDKQFLTERLQGALCEEICEFEWEQGEVPVCHAEIIGAGSTMFTHHNSVYVFGGMDDERSEHMSMWKWDLSKDEGFEPVTYRGVVPAKLTAGHYAAVHGNELWVFPGPRNHQMRRVYCLDMLRYRWVERNVTGDPPSDTHCRRNLCAMLDGRKLIVLGGPTMDKVFFFEFESRQWSSRTCKDVLPQWSFGHATKRGRSVFAVGSPRGETGTLEVRELDLATLRWRRVDAKGQLPPFRIHSSAAVVGDKWIIHGGRRPGKFNVTNQTFVYNFSTNRWSVLMAEGDVAVPREWQAALGLQDCMVVVGGRADIPDFEPIPLSCDTMCSAVEILWYRAPPQAHPPTGKAALLGSVRGLCGSEHLADVCLVVCGHRMPAHRHVLAPHSPVFERMWSSSMSEMETAEVTITDLHPTTVELLLQYCYGCLHTMPSHHAEVIELFKAADKYDVLGLVQECVASFRQLTGAHEVAPLLQVAAERHSGDLRAVCVDVAALCLPDVLEADSFRQLVAHQPELSLDFIRETALRLGCPCMPTTAATPGAEPAAPAAPAQPAALGVKPPPTAPALPLAAPCGAATASAPEAAEAGSSGGEETTPRERCVAEGPATPPSRTRAGHSPLPPDAGAHSPVTDPRPVVNDLAGRSIRPQIPMSEVIARPERRAEGGCLRPPPLDLQRAFTADLRSLGIVGVAMAGAGPSRAPPEGPVQQPPVL